MPIMHTSGCPDSPQNAVEDGSRHKPSSCFFCNEPTAPVSVSSSLLESIMKVKSYMCIPLQLKDLPVTDIFLCPKCLDIVSQIEGWIDLMRQRIFDAHEGAILYPETPIWLQALSGNSRSKEAEVVPEVPPAAEEVEVGPTASVSVTASPPLDASPEGAGVKRKQAALQSGIPPKKIAAAVAAAVEDRLAATTAASASPPCTSAAVRSAIDSLTTIMNVVQSQGAAKKAGAGGEISLPHDITSVVVKCAPSEQSFVLKPEPAPDKVKEIANPFDMEKRWCNLCCSVYHNDSVFKRHIVSVHPELCHKCELCSQLFVTVHSHAIHVRHGCSERITNRTRILRCTDCHASFLGKYELKRHVLLSGHMGGVSGGHSL